MKALSVSNKGRMSLHGSGRHNDVTVALVCCRLRIQELIFDLAGGLTRHYTAQARYPRPALFQQLIQIIERYLNEKVHVTYPADRKDRPTFANERCGAIPLDHGKPSAGGRNAVAFSCVSLLSNQQCVQLRLEGAPIDYFGRSKFISHDVFIVLSLANLGHAFASASRFRKVASPASDTSTHFGSGEASAS
jgi:hypothetical protein